MDTEHIKPQHLFEMTAQGLRLGDQIICGCFEVMGLARTPLSENWSTILKFADRDNKEHELFISTNELLDSKTLIERLAHNGLKINVPSKKEKIVEHITNYHTDQRFLILENSGWHDNGFYLPYTNSYIGTEQHRTITKLKPHSIAKTAVTDQLECWNSQLGFLMKDNSNLILAASTVLAAPLLKILGKQNYGFNFVGKSSIGKSTILEYAASVIGSSTKGSENYLCNFRTTDNALESIGWGHNDMCLMLDEFGQLEPYKVKDCIYMLGNGFTKGRSSKTGEANERKSFNITYLSSSEVGLKNVLAQSGQQTKSGLEVRFIDIEADVSSENGCYENLHGFKSGKELSDYIKSKTKKTYGSLFDSFIKKLVLKLNESDEDFKKQLMTWYNDFISATQTNNNQITNRIISSLALNYTAMMFAIENDLISLKTANLVINLQKVAHDISEKYGESHNEENLIIAEIRDFILNHRNSRFQTHQDETLKIHNRAGVIKDLNKEIHYCIFGNILKKEICSGWTLKQITLALEKHGYINKNAQDKFSHPISFGNETFRAYPIHHKILEFEF